MGGLLYVAQNTQPDILIHVNLLGRRTADLSLVNLMAAHQVYQYLLITRQEEVLYKPLEKESEDKTSVAVYIDTSYRGEGSRSQTGVLV